MSATTTDGGPELNVDFVDEAVDSLRELPNQLGVFRENPDDDDSINAVFRAVHSIKGCAGFLGLTPIKVFSHSMENTMDEVRKRKVTLTEDLERALVNGFDLLEEMLQATLEGQLGDELGPEETELVAQIERLASSGRSDHSPEQQLLEGLLKFSDEIARVDHPHAGDWSEQARSLADQYHHGAGTEGSNGEDGDEGETIALTPADFQELTLTLNGEEVTSQVAAMLEMFFAVERGEFTDEIGRKFLAHVDGFAQFSEQAGKEELTAALRHAEGDFRTILDSPLDIYAMTASIAWDHIWPQLAQLDGAPGSQPPEEATTEDDAVGAATDEKSPTKSAGAQEGAKQEPKARMVRIKEQRLDQFLDNVASLFITCELFKDLHTRLAESGQLADLVEEMRQINHSFVAQSTKLQQAVVSLQQVEVSGLFSKFPRMARSLAKQLDKKIDVHLSGTSVEVDKTLAEDLDAPLTHMIRNVADHAIQSPAERVEQGLSETGNLWLRAEKTRSHIVLTVQDDGRGINPEVMRKKAVEKGIYTQAQANELTDQDAIHLIFHPGFSTAKVVSDISGRGVGMDVVRTNLREHGGEISVESTVGKGTTFRLDIPLREAVLVIDGLMVRQSGEIFVLPFEHVREITEIDPADLHSVHGTSVATIRGESHAAISLAKLLGMTDTDHSSDAVRSAVLVGCKTGSLCLLVDDVLRHRQVVVNSIQDLLPGTETIAGVAQLGGGRLALVLSSPDLVKSAEKLPVE